MWLSFIPRLGTCPCYYWAVVKFPNYFIGLQYGDWKEKYHITAEWRLSSGFPCGLTEGEGGMVLLIMVGIKVVAPDLALSNTMLSALLKTVVLGSPSGLQ